MALQWNGNDCPRSVWPPSAAPNASGAVRQARVWVQGLRLAARTQQGNILVPKARSGGADAIQGEGVLVAPCSVRLDLTFEHFVATRFDCLKSPLSMDGC